MTEQNKGLQDEELIRTQQVPNALAMGTWQEDFGLTEVDFHHLKSNSSKTFGMGTALLGGAFGYGVPVLAKHLDYVRTSIGEADGATNAKTVSPVTFGEGASAILLFVTSVLVIAAGYWWPNDKKKLMQRIEIHFKGTEKTKLHKKDGGWQ